MNNVNTVGGVPNDNVAGAGGGGGGGGAVKAAAYYAGGTLAATANVAQLKDALRNGVQVGHMDKLNMCYNSWKRVGLIDMKRAGLVAPARFNYND